MNLKDTGKWDTDACRYGFQTRLMMLVEEVEPDCQIYMMGSLLVTKLCASLAPMTPGLGGSQDGKELKEINVLIV